MVEFTEVDGPATVYRVDSFENPTPTAVSQKSFDSALQNRLPVETLLRRVSKARSKFAEEYDVAYADCRAQLTEYLGQKVVLVGVVTNE